MAATSASRLAESAYGLSRKEVYDVQSRRRNVIVRKVPLNPAIPNETLLTPSSHNCLSHPEPSTTSDSHKQASNHRPDPLVKITFPPASDSDLLLYLAPQLSRSPSHPRCYFEPDLTTK
eukprot:GHVN01093187.1.p1 GENE.GHVN01093187.1~~GHVN01093187.1.p1  ORF type:complete len:119 (-),score=13.66 GHVN01093187.1:297-653(-)